MSYKDILKFVNYKLKQHNIRQIKLDELRKLLDEFNDTQATKDRWEGGSLRLYGYWDREHHFDEFVLHLFSFKMPILTYNIDLKFCLLTI